MYSKKVVAIAIVSAMLISFAPTPSTRHVQAVTAGDLGDSLSIPIQSFTDAAQKYAHTGYSAFGIPVPFTSLDSIMKLAVKQIIEKLQQQVIGWVTGGNNGNPIFETNINGFLSDLDFKTGTNYLSALSGDSGQVCSYFKNDLVSGLSSYFNIPNFNQISSSVCGAERQVGKQKVQQFLSGDFDGGGGWDTWSAISQNDDSNPLGAYLMHQDQIATAMSREESIQREILDQGHGFHSLTDSLGNITTPGALIADQLNQVVSSNIRQLELSKNFDDIVTALASSLISQLINGSGGLTGTAARSKSTQGTAAQSQAATTYVRPKYPTGNTTSSSDEGDGTAVSAPQNIAISGTANQSSTLVDDDGMSHDASIALTGYKNRNPKFGGVSITKSQSNPWWQVDLGKTAPIDHIDITPRIDDGYGSDLTGFYVIVSTVPLTGNNIPVDSDGVWVSTRISPSNPRGDTTTVTPPAGTLGRYVRIQEDHSARLEIAGVQVFAKSVPLVNLIGDNPMEVPLNSSFQDPGAIAIDQSDGDISENIGISGSVDTSVAGTYSLRYTVTNSQGVSSGTLIRKVIVK